MRKGAAEVEEGSGWVVQRMEDGGEMLLKENRTGRRDKEERVSSDGPENIWS